MQKTANGWVKPKSSSNARLYGPESKKVKTINKNVKKEWKEKNKPSPQSKEDKEFEKKSNFFDLQEGKEFKNKNGISLKIQKKREDGKFDVEIGGKKYAFTPNETRAVLAAGDY